MTKDELIRFLQPFDDDIEIMRFGHDHRVPAEHMLTAAEPRYILASEDMRDLSSPPITRGDGYILID